MRRLTPSPPTGYSGKPLAQKLGVGPGSVLEWEEDGEKIVVRRVGRYTSEDVHRALFPKPPKPRTLEEMKEGVRRYIKGRYACR